MATVLCISDFARMTFVSVKALRHYHEVGLLEPVEIDRALGYRKYAMTQVATAQIIRRLCDVEMPIEEIKSVLAAPDAAARQVAIFAYLARKEGELQRKAHTVGALRKVLGGLPANAPIELRGLAEKRVLAIRARIAAADVAPWRREAFDELRAAFRQGKAQRAGADAALLACELLEHEHGEITAFVPIEGPAIAEGRIVEIVLPASDVAIIMHEGFPCTIDQSFAALGAYVNERGIGMAGPVLENYLIGPRETSDEREFRTEIGWPIFRTNNGV